MSTKKVRIKPPRRHRKFIFAPYWMAGIGAVYVFIFAGLPLLKGLQLSFTDTRILRPNDGNWVGLDNYSALLSNGQFTQSILTTIVYTASCVVLAMAIGIVSAFVINHWFPGRVLARAVMIMPWAVPTVAVALVFRWIYNDGTGVANEATRALGIGSVGWLTDPQYGMISVVIASVWKMSPFVMLVVLSALQSVPNELYEAARVDGASPFRQFLAVTLPHINPSLKIVGLIMTIWSFRRFEIIWLLTGGGPVDATNTIVINVYRQAFANSQLGVAAAIGMVGLLLSVVITAVYFVVERRSEIKEGAR